jgi:uncharacterized metal-binding protein YceD (DUF177 family)
MPETRAPIFDAAVRFDNLPAGGRHVKMRASAAELAAATAVLKVKAVERFEADLEAKPMRGGVHVRGRVRATIEQLCVASFVPVKQHIDEPVDRIFLHGREHKETPAPGAEVFVDLEGEDFPDYFEGPEVDFSPLLLELVALAIDPYPRAPGVELPDLGEEADDLDASPFAELAKLKSPGD